MAEFNQSAVTVKRARAYLADVRAGHVSFADESAPFLTLTGHLGRRAGGHRWDRQHPHSPGGCPDGARRAAGCRAAALRWRGRTVARFWIARLVASLRELLGSTAAELAALEEAERDALRQALTDAVGVRAAARRPAMRGLRGSSGAAVPASCGGAGLGLVLPDAC